MILNKLPSVNKKPQCLGLSPMFLNEFRSLNEKCRIEDSLFFISILILERAQIS